MTALRSLVAVAGLLLIYATLAWLSISSKSPIYDEPLHVSASLAARQLADYRVDPEDPALFKHWMALTQPTVSLPTDVPEWQGMPISPWMEWMWSVRAVFAQPPEVTETIIARARAMMLLAAVLVGALTAYWSWKLAGPVAAVIATALFALDPLWLAHGPLAKNDGIATLAFLATAVALWQVGRRATFGWAIALAGATGVALTVKFSGILLAGIIPMVLGIRALLPTPWLMGRTSNPKRLESFGRKFALAAGLSVLAGLTGYLFIWASYGFRHSVTPDPTIVSVTNLESRKLPLLVWIDRYHLVPRAYMQGFAYTVRSTLERNAFLLGEKSAVGWWYYFPVAMAVKTPLATIAAVLLALSLAGVRGGAVFAAKLSNRERLAARLWTLACLGVPTGVYVVTALKSNLNIGVRHMLPIYPFLFIVAAVVLRRYGRVATVLLLVLAVESLTAFPHYIPFFNVAAGGSRGGLRILSDSNLDWGQDLKLLSVWQSQHPGTPLYLSYFGTAEPSAYGIDYLPLSTYLVNQPTTKSTTLPATVQTLPTLPTTLPTGKGIVAVSATHLQGMYVQPEALWFYDTLRAREPLDVLGGSIYLYAWDWDQHAANRAK